MKHQETRCGALLLAALLAGCGQKSIESAALEAAQALGPQFSAKKGLLLPDETRRSLGLQMVEVTEQTVPASVEIQLRVYQADNLLRRASGGITPEQAKLLKPGQSFQFQNNGGITFDGTVTGLSEQSLKATGMVEVLVAITDPSAELAVGRFLEVSIPQDSREKVASIPRAALLQCSDGYSVYTASGEHLVRTSVKIGAATADYVEIKDGLYSGDQVVLQPVMSLWMIELAAVKGGQACCAAPPKGK